MLETVSGESSFLVDPDTDQIQGTMNLRLMYLQ